MNPSYFGLEGHPFGSAAASGVEHRGGEALDASLLEAHEPLVTELSAGLKAPHGITLVIGEAGAGKSALLRAFTTRLAETSAVAYLPSTGPGLRHMLTEIIDQLGLSAPASDEESVLVETMRAAARATTERGRTTVIVVDSAHELPAKTIERLGKLFGDDAAEPSGLHVILVGRPELLDRMNAANDRSILKHLVQVCRMDPIGPEEALRYISDRLARVGGLVDNVFTQDAVRLIVNRAGGNPRRIDELCAAAMEQAEISGALPAGPDVVDRACAPETANNGASGNGYALGAHELETAAGTGTGTGGYVFDESDGDGDDGGAAAPPPPGRKKNRPRRSPSKSQSSGIMARVSGTRRSLVLAAVGLVAVLGFFAATMTDTGPGAIPQQPVGPGASKAPTAPAAAKTATAPKAPAAKGPAAVAAKFKGGTATAGARAEGRPGSRAAAKGDAATARGGRQRPDASAGEAALPAKPVSTAKLVVKRTPPAAGAAAASPETDATAPVRPTRPAVAPVHAAGRTKPAAAVPTEPTAPARVAAARTDRTPPPAAPTAAATPTTPAAAPAAAPAPVAAAAPPTLVEPVSPPPAAPVVAAAPASRPPPIVVTPVAPAPAAPRPAAASVGGYTVQVGAFGNRGNAEKMLARLQAKYSDGRIADAASGSSTVYRVLSGSFASKADADQRAAELGRGGFSTYVRRAQ